MQKDKKEWEYKRRNVWNKEKREKKRKRKKKYGVKNNKRQKRLKERKTKERKSENEPGDSQLGLMNAVKKKNMNKSKRKKM